MPAKAWEGVAFTQTAVSGRKDEKEAQLFRILQPGKQVANGIQGGISSQGIRRFVSKVEGRGDDPVRVFERLFQRELEVQQIVVPNLPDMLNVLDNVKNKRREAVGLGVRQTINEKPIKK